MVNKAFRRLRSKRGFVMVAALVILLTLTIMGIVMISTSALETKISSLGREEAQALFLAEAGVAKVKEWFQDPDRFTPIANSIVVTLPTGGFMDCTGVDPVFAVGMVANCTFNASVDTTNDQNFFRRRHIDVDCDRREYTVGDLNIDGNCVPSSGQRTRTQFADTTGDGAQDAFSPLDDGTDTPAVILTNLNQVFGDFQSVGRITSIRIYPPISSYGRPYPICTVRVTAETNTGFSKTIDVEIRESDFLPINAGAQAGGGGQFNGSGEIHWGDLVAKGNIATFNVNNNAQKKCDAGADSDPWFRMRVGGVINTPGGGIDNSTCPTVDTDDCMTCEGIDGDPTKRTWQDYSVYQNMGNDNITLDKWDRDKMKAYAKSYGYYYKIDPADPGQVYQSNANGDLIGQPIPLDGADGMLTDLNRSSFLFIDAGGTGTVEVSLGGSFYSKGDIFVDGSLDLSGGGSGNDIQRDKPDHTAVTLNNINFDGVLYMTGNLTGSGNPRVFGGVVAEGGLTSSGTPEIWYDIELKEGRRFQPKTGKGRWREIMQ